MNGELFHDLEIIAPLINTATRLRGCVVAITTSSARTNLAPLLTALNQGDANYFDFTADGGNVYFFLNNSDAGTIDEAATGAGVTVAGGVLFNGVTRSFKIPNGYTWIVAKGSAACNLRIAVSSRGYNQQIGESTGDL